MRHDSVTLPPLIELDEDGYEWVVAAAPPSSETRTSEEGESRVDETSTSVVHMVAPPPPPPTTTSPTLGALTPSQVLRNEEISSIVNVREDEMKCSF